MQNYSFVYSDFYVFGQQTKGSGLNSKYTSSVFSTQSVQKGYKKENWGDPVG
jgi:hypothetical protein